ncbi:hypothetical protein KK141_17275 [Dyella sp. LX-66]|uniref:hypothetical protein n=1 Tax=unclassified Dyella TaxID=2634549 RepID=UPI001BE06F9B|nr:MULTISPECIES: hypothetical protein [unclassified Dyella]MBT2117786.1 hypothetical protein [Dyella sp. LX-1]MBT2141301.1 hypothetical protein [Dyella sp. LX-66]
MSKRRRRRHVESDFMEALERLKMGRPRDSSLLKRVHEGRLVINPVTVALEANRSRTLIGSDSCKYPHIRELVLQAGGRGSDRPLRQDVITKLRETIKVLQGDLAAARTIMAAQRITIDALSRTEA